MKLSEIIIERIKARLEATGKSAAAASLEAGVGRSAIQSILTGASESPRVETLSKLSRALDCTLPYLIGETDDPKNWNDPTTFRSLSNLPQGVVQITDSVLRVGRDDFWPYEVDQSELPPEDRLLVRDNRYPHVPVGLFEIITDRYREEGISKGDIVTALLDLKENSVAIQNESFLITRLRRVEDGHTMLNIGPARISSGHVNIDGYTLGTDSQGNAFQSLVYPGGRLVVLRENDIDLGEGIRLEIIGLVIRSLRLWKRSTVY